MGRTPYQMGRAPHCLGRTPNNMGRAPNRMGRAPNKMGHAPFNMGRTPNKMGRAPHNMGRTPFSTGRTNFSKCSANFSRKSPIFLNSGLTKPSTAPMTHKWAAGARPWAGVKVAARRAKAERGHGGLPLRWLRCGSERSAWRRWLDCSVRQQHAMFKVKVRPFARRAIERLSYVGNIP